MTYLTIKRYILKILKLNNYKKNYRLMTKLPKYLNDTLIGLLLSDGGLERPFESYIHSDIKILDIKGSNKSSSKMYSTVKFKTISMPQLLYYYNIFYKKNIITNK